MHDGGIDHPAHWGQGVEQRVPVARGREPAVEHRNHAAVMAAPDQAARALREHERGGGEIDVAKPVAPGLTLGGFAPGLGEGVVGPRERQAVDDDQDKAGPFPKADRPVAHIISSRWSTEEARDRLNEAGEVMDKAGARLKALTPVTEPRKPHHYALNFSRGWALLALAEASGDAALLGLALDHISVNLQHPSWWRGDYRSVSHWVPQFGIFALQRAMRQDLPK